MNKKVSLLILTFLLTIVVFIVSIYLQKKAVNYVPTIKCLVATNDVEAYETLTKDDVTFVDMPVSIVANSKIATSFDDVSNLYLKDKIYKGQIILQNEFDTKENLMIFKSSDGTEKISIKVKSSENASSYTLKEGSKVNIYATISNDFGLSPIFNEFEKETIGDEYSGYTVIKLLNGTPILETFTETGELVSTNVENSIDTILIAVEPSIASKINLIRDIASFNVTEI